MELKDLMKYRFLFLHRLYKKFTEDGIAVVPSKLVFQELELNESDNYKIIDYLAINKLIKHNSKVESLEITPLGVSEIKILLQFPDKSTNNFLPLNLIDIGKVSNSTIEKGDKEKVNPTIAFSATFQEIKKVTKVLRKYEDKLSLPIELHTELFCEIRTIESQLDSPKPKKVILTISLKTIKNILEGFDDRVLPLSILNIIDQLVNYKL